jgi:hypothetical protein
MLFSKKNVIKFATSYDFLGLPKAAKNFVPEWYKKSEKVINGSKEILDHHGNKKLALKACMPFADSLLSGYMVYSWQDIQVTRDANGIPNFAWPIEPDPLQSRPSDGDQLLPVPAGHDGLSLVWLNKLSMKTPAGYSVLITHPLNRFDLPFTTLSAIVDSDSVMYPGRVPFFIKSDFEGVIKKGTPIYQVIPFKREDWVSQKDEAIIKEGNKNMFNATSVISGWYKQNYWKKKMYYDGNMDA